MAQNILLQRAHIGRKCRGTRAKYMKLISDDGFSFYIEKRLALTSDPLREMYLARRETNIPYENVLCFNGVRGRALESVCKYMHYRDHYEEIMPRYDLYHPFPKFEIEPEDSLESFLAAIFFNI